MTDEVQRSLGRIEGTQTRILDELTKLRDDFGAHKADDQRNFSSLRVDMKSQFEANDRARNEHLTEQDTKLDIIQRDSDRAKGAGWAILGIMGLLASLVGGAVMAALSGWIKIHT